jgi:hypothetical protein
MFWSFAISFLLTVKQQIVYIAFDNRTTIEKLREAVVMDQNSATESPGNEKISHMASSANTQTQNSAIGPAFEKRLRAELSAANPSISTQSKDTRSTQPIGDTGSETSYTILRQPYSRYLPEG